MIKYLQFRDVGRGKYSGKILLPKTKLNPDEIADLACKEARKHLTSHDVETYFDAQSNEGVIFAGLRKIGTFYIYTTGI